MSNQPMTAEDPMAGEELLRTLELWAKDLESCECEPFTDEYVQWMAEQLLFRRMAEGARALLARVADLETMVTPRPIESAPKDEQVLVFCPEESDYGYTAAWLVGEYVLHSWEGGSRLDDGVQPTHWLPLPPDPTEVKQP
jgi:hypothetical protein